MEDFATSTVHNSGLEGQRMARGEPLLYKTHESNSELVSIETSKEFVSEDSVVR